MSTSIADLPFTQPAPMPERDIPRETISHAADPQTTSNYMPRQQGDYIPPPSKYDYAYLVQEFRLPAMMALLYYVFQLDVIQDFIQRTLPVLFQEGKVTSNGALVKGGLFGAAYYAVTLLMHHFK